MSDHKGAPLSLRASGVRIGGKPSRILSSINRFTNMVDVEAWNALCGIINEKGVPCTLPLVTCKPHGSQRRQYLKKECNNTHLASVSNMEDHRSLTQVIVKLQEDRGKTMEELEFLTQQQEEALRDPLAFVAKIQQDALAPYPRARSVRALPRLRLATYRGERESMPPPIPALPGLAPTHSTALEPGHTTSSVAIGLVGAVVGGERKPKSTTGSNPAGNHETAPGARNNTLLSVEQFFGHSGRRRQLRRRRAGLPHDPIIPTGSSSKKVKREAAASDASHAASDDNSADRVRGRALPKEENVPATFNQLWTDEEQGRLVKLLEVFPEEEVASHRWQKIADALGNRTAKQVASRCQKYFIKLAKEGKHVPGKVPDVSRLIRRGKKKGKRKGKRRAGARFGPVKTRRPRSPSEPVFPPTAPPPPTTTTTGSNAAGTTGVAATTIPKSLPAGIHLESSSDEDNVPETVRKDPQYQEMKRLKREQKRRSREQVVSAARSGNSGGSGDGSGLTGGAHHSGPLSLSYTHLGYACDACHANPIQGTRYTCQVCDSQDEGVDLCATCYQRGTYTKGTHTLDHPFREYRTAEHPSYVDDDYLRAFAAENYLDVRYDAP